MSDTNEQSPQSAEDPQPKQLHGSLPGEGLLSREVVAEPIVTKPYSESDDHVPDPTAMSGTLETTGVGAGHHSRLEGVVEVFSRVFHHHRHEPDAEAAAPPVEQVEPPADPSVGQPAVPAQEALPVGDAPADTEKNDEGAKATAKKTAAKKASPPDTAKK